jgi:exopolysaccharide biosynthesis polyprenyl glycosylphosphotransferase
MHKLLFMNSKKATFLAIGDICLLLISFLLAYATRHYDLIKDHFNLPLQFRVYLVCNIFLWIMIAYKFKLYKQERFSLLRNEWFDLLKTASVSMFFATIPAFYFREDPLSRLFLVYHWITFNLMLVCFRIVYREFLKHIRMKGYDERNVIIIGRNQRTKNIVDMIEASPRLGIKIIGLVDAGDGKCPDSDDCGYPFLGDVGGLEDILKNTIVDDVIVTLPMKSFYNEIDKIIGLCEKIGIDVKLLTNFFGKGLSKVNLFKFKEMQFLNYYTSPIFKWQLFAKRLFDLTLSTLALFFISPLFTVISAAIKLDSKGPVFFVQRRIGYNGRIFSLFKFRTMIENADDLKESFLHLNEQDGPIFKIRNDPRITRVGRLLRKTSLDELPQLLNVIKGDMSLVGPRPPVPDEVSKYELTDRRRLSIRPGITCIWQVNGRNKIAFDEWMELDRNYIDNWSLWLDFKIMLKTIPAVLKGTGM